VRGRRAVDVGVDQHVVIEPVDRVVERGGVEAKLDPRSTDRVPQVQQAKPDPGGKAIADLFLLAPPTHRFGVRISEGKAHFGPLLGLGGKQLGDLWIAVRQEQPGIDQYVDAIGGGLQEAAPQRSWDGAAVGIEADQLRCADRLSMSLVGELGPQIGLVGPQQRRGCPAV
jgi:hypothetical protein